MSRQSLLALACLIAVPACVSTAPPALLENDPPAPPQPQGEALFEPVSTAPLLVIDPAIVGDDRVRLQAWIDTAVRTLRSQRFAANMASLQASYPSIWLSSAMPARSPSALQQLLTAPASPARYLSTRLVFRQQPNKISVGSDPRAGHRTAIMYIGRNHLNRSFDTNEVAKSCAINSLVHEITHTLSASATQFQYGITDTGSGTSGSGGLPLASYFTGSVAQCTYLQERGIVPAGGLNACVANYGTRSFYSRRCTSYPHS